MGVLPAFEVWDLRAPPAPEAVESTYSADGRASPVPLGVWSPGALVEPRLLMDGEPGQRGDGDARADGLLVEGLKPFNPTFSNTRQPEDVLAFIRTESGHVQKRMSNLKFIKCNHLTSRLLVLGHVVILVDETYTSFKMVVTGLSHFPLRLLLKSMS